MNSDDDVSQKSGSTHRMTDTNQPDPQLASLRAQAINYFDKAHQIIGCVLAVEDNEMSINEARRWLELDEEGRLMVEYGPTDGYTDRAEQWLQTELEERR